MAAIIGQTWGKLASANDSLPGSYKINAIFVRSPTQTVTLKAPFSSTTKELFGVTSWTGSVPLNGTCVQGSIVATTLGAGAEVFVYWA